MGTILLIAIMVIIAVVVVLVALVALRQRRTRRLQDRFGPEYERAVEQTGRRRAAEAELAEREEHREQLRIVELDPAARARYLEAWQATQAKFVDDPKGATREADQLITGVMRDRGYPVEDFEQRAGDISVDHPNVVENYRSAHAASVANESGRAGTDELRQALVHYRSLFAELLEAGHDGGAREPQQREPQAREAHETREPHEQGTRQEEVR
jgi:hypothetical protein